MKEEVYLINLTEIRPSTFVLLKRNLLRNNIPLTIDGLRTFGLKNLYDFDKVADVLDPRALNDILYALEKRGVFLDMTQEDFDAIDFDLITKDYMYKNRLHETLVKHGILELPEKGKSAASSRGVRRMDDPNKKNHHQAFQPKRVERELGI